MHIVGRGRGGGGRGEQGRGVDDGGIRAVLRSRTRLCEERGGDAALARAVRAGELRRIHRGWYVDEDWWGRARPEDRHLAQTMSVHASQRIGRAVFVGTSAAVLWGLPLYRIRLTRVHVAARTLDGRTTSSADDVARHEFAVAADQRARRFGMECTDLARTVLDIARTTALETAVAAADAAFRLRAWRDDTRDYDEHAAAQFRQELEDDAVRAAGSRGIRQARWVIAFADGRAQLPGESHSRILLRRLGFAAPRLQVPVASPSGGEYRVDFGLDDVGAWGEFDGESKYLMPDSDGARDPDAAWRAEKRREDWIRGTTRRPVVRWTSADLTPAGLADRLRAFGIHPPR